MKSGQWPNVAVEAGSNPAEVMRRYDVKMTATDELRKLLDERGVEYEAERIDFSNYSTWGKNDCYSYTEYPDGTVLRIWDCTPEQAITATLGSGTCKLEETESYSSERGIVHVLECSNCGQECEHVNGDYEYCPHCLARNALF